jgi:hypothetical protein
MSVSKPCSPLHGAGIGGNGGGAAAFKASDSPGQICLVAGRFSGTCALRASMPRAVWLPLAP